MTDLSYYALEQRPAEEILAWGARTFEKVTFATGFGVEGCVLIDLIARHRLPIDVFTVDTGLLFPETYELWRALEARYGLTIRAVRPKLSVEDQAAAACARLWEQDPDRCCELRKVLPLRQALQGFGAWVSAIRRDQSSTRAAAPVVEWSSKFGLFKLNPLATWTAKHVWDYVHRHGVPYNPLHDRGYPSIGCAPCTTAVAPGEHPRAGRWRGRTKTECGLHTREEKPSNPPSTEQR